MPFFDGLKQIKPSASKRKKNPDELRKRIAYLRSHISVLRKRNNELREQLKAVQKAARELASQCSCWRNG